MKAIGITITSDCVTTVELRTFFGLKRVTAVHTESIDWQPFDMIPGAQVTDALQSIHQRLKLNKADISLCIPNYRFCTHRLKLASNKSRKMNKSELNYLFEENLPVDIEKIVARHSYLKADKTRVFYLSSGLVIYSVRHLLKRMEEANINVSCLSGDLFYIGDLIAKKVKPEVVAICAEGNLTGIVVIRRKKIVLTRYLNLGCSHKTETADPESKDSITSQILCELELTLADIDVDKKNLQVLVLGNGPYSAVLQSKVCETLGLDKDSKASLNKTSILSKKQASRLHNLSAISAFTAARAALSPSKFDFNFCCNRLVSSVGYKKLYRPFIATAVLFIVLIVANSFLLYRESVKWQQRSLLYHQQQARLWREVFPDLAVPSDIAMRLASEKKRLEGLAGQGTGLPSYKSSLDTLRSVISGIPDFIDLRIKDIKIDQDKIVIIGQSKNFTMVEHLTTAMGQLREFNMQPAESKRVNENIVGFTLRGSIINYNKPIDGEPGVFNRL